MYFIIQYYIIFDNDYSYEFNIVYFYCNRNFIVTVTVVHCYSDAHYRAVTYFIVKIMM